MILAVTSPISLLGFSNWMVCSCRLFGLQVRSKESADYKIAKKALVCCGVIPTLVPAWMGTACETRENFKPMI